MQEQQIYKVRNAGPLLRKYLELSGPRGIDYAPPELTSVHGYRYVLHVTLPNLEPASKRRRV